MKKSTLCRLVAITTAVLLLGPQARGQTSVGVDKITVTAGCCNWTIEIKGKTTLDAKDQSATSLTVTITDPNSNGVKIASQLWAKPKPGSNTPFTTTSVAVAVKGVYDYVVTFEYVDAAKQKKISSVKGSFNVP